MAEITNELNNIMNAQYGKDVRQSIYDAIDAINTQANEATTNVNTMTAEALEQVLDQLAIDLTVATVAETQTFLGIT